MILRFAPLKQRPPGWDRRCPDCGSPLVPPDDADSCEQCSECDYVGACFECLLSGHGDCLKPLLGIRTPETGRRGRITECCCGGLG